MGFFGYVLLGAIAYGLGWLVRNYVLGSKNALSDKKIGHNATNKSDSYQKSSHSSQQNKSEPPIYGLKHPLVIGYLLGFFIIMLGVSALIGRYVLQHTELDMAFIVVNSMVATFVFSFGLIKDQVKHDLPD